MMNTSATLTLIGGPTLLIELNGFRLLTDPTFDPPGSYAAGPGVTLEKTVGPAIAMEDIGPLDAILLSHDQHFDNLDHSGRDLIPTVPTTLTTIESAARIGSRATGMAPFETRILGGAATGRQLFLTATPARHGPVGIEPISGSVVGFLIGTEEPGDAIYITGDTVWYEGTAEVARQYKPKLVILFTGSAQPRGRFHMTMDSNDALEAAQAFPEAELVAIHNEGWQHFMESGAELAQSFTTVKSPSRLTILEPGKATSFGTSRREANETAANDWQ